MRNFLFGLGVAAGALVEIASIKLYQSVDGQAGWAEVDAIAVGALIDDLTGKKRWDSVIADPLQFCKLVAVSASGRERPDGIVLPPLPVDPASFVVYVHTIDAGMGIEVGLAFGIVAKDGVAVAAGDKTVAGAGGAVTNDQGYAALPVPSDAGVFTLMLGKHRAEVNSANRAGEAVNFATLLVAVP